MKTQVIKIGKPAFDEFNPLVKEYEKRLQKPGSLAPENTLWKSRQDRQADSKELLMWMEKIKNRPQHRLVLLDERGKQFSSPDFAEQVRGWRDDPAISQLTFVIGGPFGFSEQACQQADLLWCLGKTVITSDLAWLEVWEQIYRADSILNGSKYHHS